MAETPPVREGARARRRRVREETEAAEAEAWAEYAATEEGRQRCLYLLVPAAAPADQEAE